MQPTFLRLFADDNSRATEYVPLAMIERATITKTGPNLAAAADEQTRRQIAARHEPETILTVTVAGRATTLTLVGAEAGRVIAALDALSPALLKEDPYNVQSK